MTIEKGRDWAQPADPEAVAASISVADDAAVAAHVATVTDEGGPTPVVTPRSGALLRTVGLVEPRTDGAHLFDVDLALVTLDGRKGTVPFVAHLVVPPGWRRPGVFAMNAPWWRSLRMAPRGHPNDGLLDVVHGRIPPGEVREAWRRARTGSHLPHPGLRIERVAQWSTRFESKAPIWIDGRWVGRARSLSIEIRDDAFRLLV